MTEPIQPTEQPEVETPTVPLHTNEASVAEPVIETPVPEKIPQETFAEPNPKVELSLNTTHIEAKEPENMIPVPFIQSGSESLDNAKVLISGIPEDRREQHFKQDWVQSVNLASLSFVPYGIFDKRLDAPNAAWKQYVEHEGVKLRASKPKLGSNSESGQLLTGDKAVMKIRSLTGMGSFYQIPLWHSGIWLLLKTPSDSELLLLDQRIQHEKSVLGLNTNGLIFSNTSSYLVDILTSFVIDHVVDSTVKDSTNEKLKSLIRATDIPLLIWGIVSTIYPNGYPFAHACVTDPTVCQHVMHTTIAIHRLLWTDTSSFTKEQRKHMANRKAIYTEDQILAYQAMSEWGSAKSVTISDSLRATLKVPTIREYVSAGYKWIAEVNATVDELLNKSMSFKERREYVTKQSIITMARQYGHWVSRLVGTEQTDDGPKDYIIEDQDTMDEIMSSLSGDHQLLNVFVDEIAKYIEDSSVAVVALPRTNCPSCGKPMSEEYAKHPNLQVLNIDQVFFILRLQRLSPTEVVRFEG